MEKQRGTENKFNLRCQEAPWQGQEKSSQPVCCVRFRAAGIKFPIEYTSVWKLKGKVPGTRHVWVSVKHGTFGKQFRRQDMASWYFSLVCALVYECAVLRPILHSGNVRHTFLSLSRNFSSWAKSSFRSLDVPTRLVPFLSKLWSLI